MGTSRINMVLNCEWTKKRLEAREFVYSSLYTGERGSSTRDMYLDYLRSRPQTEELP